MLTFPWFGMDPYENFALEYYLATEDLPEKPLVFLWRTRPGLMIGHYQNSYQEVKEEVLKTHDLFLVRRKSGGGTIFTDPGTIQYSVVDPHPKKDADFASYMAPLLEGLQALGYPVTFKGRNDLEIHGKKCSGHAQYRRKGILVHHGSLLVQADLKMMAAASSPDPMKMTSKGITSIRDRVSNIDQQKTRSMDGLMEDLSLALTKDAQYFDVKSLDWDRIRQIAKNEFASWEALYGGNPDFSVERKARFSAGSLCILMEIKKGIIHDLKLSGDFFAGPHMELFEKAALGQELRLETLKSRMIALGVEAPIRGISVDQILELICE